MPPVVSSRTEPALTTALPRLDGGRWIERLLALGFLVCVAGLFARAMAANWSFTTDDAYITLRYADHLRAGHGVVWNVGESPPVEGYSNFLYVLLGALAIRSGWDPIFLFKLLGIAGVCGTVAATWLIARTWLGPLAALLPAYFLAVYPGESYWAVSGLETTFYQALVALSLAAFLRMWGFGPAPPTGPDAPDAQQPIDLRWWAISAALATLASLTRPEGPLIAAFLAVAVFWRLRWRLRPWLVFGLAYVVPVAIYHAWRLAHFGELLPHALVCKAAYTGDPWSLFRDYVSLAAPFAVFALFYPWRKMDVRHGLLMGIPLTYAVLLYGIDPIIGQYNRHALVAFALLVVPAAVGLVSVAGRVRASLGRHVKEFLLVAAVGLYGVVTWTDPATSLRVDASHYARRMEARGALHAWLVSHVEAADTVLVGDAGLIPYRLQADVTDAFCLNCLDMSRPPIRYSPAKFADWIFRRSPRFLVVHSSREDRLVPRIEYGVYPAIVRHEEFGRRYRHVVTFGAPGDDFHYWVFERVGARGAS